MSLPRADHSSRAVLPSVVCLSVIVKPQHWGRPGPIRDVAPKEEETPHFGTPHHPNVIFCAASATCPPAADGPRLLNELRGFGGAGSWECRVQGTAAGGHEVPSTSWAKVSTDNGAHVGAASRWNAALSIRCGYVHVPPLTFVKHSS
jgi:hypothetical protein